MTYQEIFETVKKALSKAKAKAVSGNVAFEFDIVGEGEGKFYIEVKDGNVNIEPYNYYDNDARLEADADTFIKIATGALKPETAYADGQLKIDGDVGKALELKALVESVPAPRKRTAAADKKPAEKKPSAKKAAKVEPEKKAEAAALVKAEPVKEDLPAAKKAAAKKA